MIEVLRDASGFVNFKTFLEIGGFKETDIERYQSAEYYYLKLLESEKVKEIKKFVEKFLAEHVLWEELKKGEGTDEDSECHKTKIFPQIVEETLVKKNIERALKEGSGRGITSSRILDIVKGLAQPPEITWQNVLRHIVGTTIFGEKRSIWRRNRRQPERFDLSGKLRDKTFELLIGVDVSGSISRDELRSALKEIIGIVSSVNCVPDVIQFDSEYILPFEKLSSKFALSNNGIKRLGNGGTTISSVFQFALDRAKRRNKLTYKIYDFIIIFTDGCGESKLDVLPTSPGLIVLSATNNRISFPLPRKWEVKRLKT
jgi:predicted metal-dependent peptidase